MQKLTELSQQQKSSLMFNIVASYFSHCPDIPTMRPFADPVKPQWSTTECIGPLMDTNKAAWGVNQTAADDRLVLSG